MSCKICGFPITSEYKGDNLCPNHLAVIKKVTNGNKELLFLLKDKKFVEYWTVKSHAN